MGAAGTRAPHVPRRATSGQRGGGRRRRVAQLTALSAGVVLFLDVATLALRLGALPLPDVGFPASRGPSPASAASASTEPAPRDDADGALDEFDGLFVAVPVHELDYLPEVMRAGVLQGDAGRDGGCLWLEHDGQAQAVKWFPGARAHFPDGEGGSERVELLDASGVVLARGGDTVYFTGALSGAAERLERCHVGGDHVWYVGDVRTDSPFD